MTILVDMDDTIENLLPAWVERLNQIYGTHIVAEDITEWDMTKTFPGTKQEIFSVLDGEGFWNSVMPKAGASEYLKRLIDEGHEVYVVTASGYQTVQDKFELVLQKYFPFINWNHVIICKNKQMINGDVLVDDGVHNLIGGKYKKILFTAPHNRSYDADSNGMVRCDTWAEVYTTIKQYAK